MAEITEAMAMSARPLLIVATRNAHKTAEIRAMLAASHEVSDMAAFPEAPVIEETGVTFLENARLKALGISRLIDGIVLSDDSGLEVDALNGAPGVWSSSYGGVEGDHARNNARLLREMAEKTDRTARFRCTMVLAQGGNELAYFTGAVDGRIIGEPRGTEGFGYDPLFIPAGHEHTFAELGEDVKNTLSHRARALARVVEWLAGQGSAGGLPAS